MTRGRVHFFDSENATRTYKKNIDRDIAKAYKAALAYVKDRISGYCVARGADYMLVSAEDSMSKVFFENMIDMGVLK